MLFFALILEGEMRLRRDLNSLLLFSCKRSSYLSRWQFFLSRCFFFHQNFPTSRKTAAAVLTSFLFPESYLERKKPSVAMGRGALAGVARFQKADIANNPKFKCIPRTLLTFFNGL